jgi:cytosine/adenosine deaminase-related metal-dependent hydrolase
LLGPDVQLINPTAYDEADRAAVAQSGAPVSVSPREEELSLVLPQIIAMLKQETVVSLSIDTTSTSGNTDMFAQMHALMDVQQFGLSEDSLAISPRQVLEMATIGGARTLGTADRVGSLTPGKRADLILVRKTDLNMAPLGDALQAIVRSAQPHNVDTVVVDGRILKRKGQLIAFDPEQVVREAAESLAAVRARAGGP